MTNKPKRKQKLIIPDRKYRKWNERCVYEISDEPIKYCNRLLDEDTGECPLGHGAILHLCATKCCAELIGGNHKFCKYHRKDKVKSICKIQEKIMKKYKSLMWGKNAKHTGLALPEDKKTFELWKLKQLGMEDKIPEYEQYFKEKYHV